MTTIIVWLIVLVVLKGIVEHIPSRRRSRTRIRQHNRYEHEDHEGENYFALVW